MVDGGFEKGGGFGLFYPNAWLTHLESAAFEVVRGVELLGEMLVSCCVQLDSQ